MLCPKCGKANTRVVRTKEDKFRTYRRRRCPNCKAKFDTLEMTTQLRARVVKTDGRSQPFNPEKLLASINLACRKLGNITLDDRIEVYRNVTEALAIEFTQEDQIYSRRIGELVAKFLADLDTVAWLRYSTYFYSYEELKRRICSDETI